MTPATPLPACSILILAGGRGQRMGGRDKGLVEWHGRPLIEHLYQVARPLTDDLIVSCNRNAERYAAYADQLVSDSEADFPGPLAGILAGLRQARHDTLLVLPCDAPLVDQDLLLNMRLRATQAPEHPLMLRRGEQWEPLFTVLPNSVLAVLEQAWQNGERSPRRALQACAIQPFDCAQDDARLANLNTPELLVDTAPHE